MQTINTLFTLAAFITCAFTLSACAHRTDRIDARQDARTHGVETRHDRYDARHEGRQDRRQIRSNRADARYDRW